MPVSFNTIPSNLRVPLAYVEFDNSGAIKGTPVMEWRILVIGQKEQSATGPSLSPTLITNADQAAELWGQGSMLASMFRSIKRANTFVETWGLAVEDAAESITATATVTIGGQCTSTGLIYLYIEGERITCKAVAGEAITATASRLAGIINATATLPVHANAAEGLITLTCKWGGSTGNDIDLRANYSPEDATPKGLTLACTPFKDGAGNPDLAPIIAAFGDQWWKSLVMPYTDTTSRKLLEEWLDIQFGPLKQQECQCWSALRGTLAATSAYGNSGNCQLISCMAIGKSPSSPWNWAAAYATVATASLSSDPARPLQTLVLPGIKPPALEGRWTMEERNILLFDGIATHMVTSDDKVAIEREITMYQTNSWGMPDPSYLDVQTPATLGYWRYAVRSRITQKFPRHKLADDNARFGPGQAIVTPRILRAELLALHGELEWKGLLENIDAFKEGLIVERNPDDRNRMDVLAPPDLVNQFRVFAMLTRFVL